MLKVNDLYFSYEAKKPILQGIDFELAKGELACLLGLSGSGKTSLLRLCAGFERPTRGRIELRGETVAGEKGHKFVDCRQRRIGFVFQDFALFNHMSVAQNIEYPCTTPQHTQTARELIELLGLEQLLKKRPYELSGGEKQRVALARSLVLQPDLLLLDEPFSNIDVVKTNELVRELRELFKRLEVTALMVTHSQFEAIDFSDQILLLHQGRLVQQGTPSELYQNPASDFVAQFFGDGSKWIDGRFLRPEQLEFCDKEQGSPGTVVSSQFRFHQWFIEVRVQGIQVRVLADRDFPSGEKCFVRVRG